ncbi:MAG: hypothetical protein R3C53_20915 [Pirellulaceae bacterium]
MPLKTLTFGTICLLCLHPLAAQTIQPLKIEEQIGSQFGKPVKLIVDEEFSGDSLPKNWNPTYGQLEMGDGKLRVSQLATDKHAAAFRFRSRLQDCKIVLQLKLGEAEVIHIGFDPAVGELKKKGHLMSLVIKADSCSLIEHNDKSDPKSKPKIHATVRKPLDPKKTIEVQLYSFGNRVQAKVGDDILLEAESEDFHVAKPGIVFRVIGKDDAVAEFDRLQVWSLE